jgi:molecular chaperone GrpE
MDDQNIPQDADEQKTEPAASEQNQTNEYLAGWKRAQADYANLKREVERERTEFSKYANQRLLENLLPAIDQFETALDHLPDLSGIPEEAQKKLQNWFTGIKAVRSLWEMSFREIGLEKVATDGTFDPQIHEAVGEEDGDEPGKIVRATQSGWKLHGRLLRPARVVIAKQSGS